jgi:cbb3-type cytochrome oxidase maturation protein
MTILYLLIPLGLLLLGLAVAAFFWATRSGQFDDLDSPAWSVVMDDDSAPRSATPRKSGNNTIDTDHEDQRGE